MTNYQEIMDQPQRFKDDGVAMTKEELAQAIANLPDVVKEDATESRAIRLSTLDRQIIKDSDQCPQCIANNDPRNVPVHPNCHCNVVTDQVETGVVDPESRLLDVLRVGQQLIDMEVIDGSELPTGIQLNPETIAVFDPEDVRWADLARWVEQMSSHLTNSQYITLIIEEDEVLDDIAASIVESSVAVGTTDTVVRSQQLWFAIAKAVTFA